MKRVILFLAAAGVALIAYAVWQRSAASRTPDPESRLNVVLVTIDTLRADRLGRGLTPSIDALAARGASFAHVRAVAPLTLPSHVSLMTGTIPPVHGVRENGQVFDRKRPTLARLFKDAGYRTGGFVGAYVLNRRFGLDEGFDVYDDAVRRDVARAEQLEAERPGGDVVDAALRWLPDDAAPFFMWIHLYDPHAPYAPPPEYLQKAGGNAYDGEVAYVDAQVGRLLDALARRGLTGRTVVVVTGDHGESLGEHGEQTHGMLLYDATLRVPLVIAAPGFVASSNQPCHIEVASAVLGASGLAERAPPTMSASTMLRPAGTAFDEMSTVCLSYSESRYPRRAGWHALTSTTDTRWKLIASSEHELYDLENDPQEAKNVAAAHASMVQAMADKLSHLQPVESRTATVAPEAAERLRALGYASGSSPITSDDPRAANPARVIGAWTAFEQALSTLQSGRAASAVPALRRLVGEHPAAPVFHTTYAQALKDAGDPRAAVAVYRRAVARWPNDPAMFHDLAVAAREAGDLAEAARAEQAALALDGTSAMAHNGLGLLHADAGRSQDAAAAFDRATEQDPSNPSYWTNLGNARAAMSDGDGAEAAYRRVLDIDPDFADALNGLGTLRVHQRRAGEAVPLFERALRRDPALHEARLNLGIAYQESGDTARAAAAYRDVLANAPPSARREREAAAALLKALR